MATIAVRGVELHYEERGEGRPVVFLHGVWMSGRFFDPATRPGRGAMPRDLPSTSVGTGSRTKPESGHTVPEYAADVRAFLEALDLDDVVLVGWSMGAFVIWEYVKQFGCDRLAGTVVVDEAASDFAWDGLATRNDRSRDVARPERGRAERAGRPDPPLHPAHVQGGADRGGRRMDGAKRWRCRLPESRARSSSIRRSGTTGTNSEPSPSRRRGDRRRREADHPRGRRVPRRAAPRCAARRVRRELALPVSRRARAVQLCRREFVGSLG